VRDEQLPGAWEWKRGMNTWTGMGGGGLQASEAILQDTTEVGAYHYTIVKACGTASENWRDCPTGRA